MTRRSFCGNPRAQGCLTTYITWCPTFRAGPTILAIPLAVENLSGSWSWTNFPYDGIEVTSLACYATSSRQACTSCREEWALGVDRVAGNRPSTSYNIAIANYVFGQTPPRFIAFTSCFVQFDVEYSSSSLKFLNMAESQLINAAFNSFIRLLAILKIILLHSTLGKNVRRPRKDSCSEHLSSKRK